MQLAPAADSPTRRSEAVGGLTSQEAQRLLTKVGFNEPARVKRAGAVVQFLLLFANPLVLILLVTSLVSALLGESVSAAIIVVIVLLGIAIDFVQTYRSQRAVERLREGVALTATVLRDGAWMEMPSRQIVPGDMIRLSAGDMVPADARLLTARDLHVQQAALTGESMPVEKEARESDSRPSHPAEALNEVFLGTSVVSGTATAEVTATGPATAFGEIAARLAARPPETEFDRGTRRFSYLILRTVFFLVLFVAVVSIARKRDPIESLLFAVALAVGLTPEFLPMIVSVTLAHAAVRMARQKVIVKDLAVMQNFGSMDILCSDKTGTLTTGVMSFERPLDPLGRSADHVFQLAYLNSYYETGIKSPLDTAILQQAQPNVEPFHKVDEVPFDFERRRLSVVVEKDGKRTLITKGSPEGVMAVCSSFEVDGQIRPLDAEAHSRCQSTYQALSAQGYRVLGVASRAVPIQEAYRIADEKDLVLTGFLTFVDPPRPDVREVLQALRRDGVQVKILTGDNELVTRHICEQVGLDGAGMILGDALDSMTETALAHVAEESTIFARVSPAQKDRILLALKRRSHVVGFLGDGINDAPSLHTADVGISVATAVDVAKDAAQIILMESGLGVLHLGILEGRKAFGNVVKYLMMGTSSNFGNVFSMAIATLFLPFLPMLPMQVLLNNLLYDLSQITIPTDNVDPSFIGKPRRWDISMIRNFMLIIGPISSLFDFLTFYVLLSLFHASQEFFHTGWFVESLATQTLVLLVIRTTGNPLRSKPSLALVATVIAVVLIGALLPVTPLAPRLGFTPLPITFFVFLVAATAIYLVLVELVKRPIVRRYFD
ncbi:MAG TPA: magnesium-translocating P-type ATPase [Planctomycetaceae bacterium]|nr:magnesium-translocating P-type ATPase [Planctomycetaceae bacterium]